MNGPEHYRAADQALQLADDSDRCEPGDMESRYYVEMAKARALLALAAAVARLEPVVLPLNMGAILGRTDDDVASWAEVLQ